MTALASQRPDALRSPRTPLFAGVWLRLSASVLLLLPLLLLGSLATPGRATASQAVDVIFVLDNSGSMKQNDPSFLTRQAVSNFAEAISKDPEIDARLGLVLFDSNGQLAQPLLSARDAAAKGALDRALSDLDFSGQHTNSPAGIERALYELRVNGREEARQAIIFLSDGKIDTGNPGNDLEKGRWLREDVAEESEASGIRIFGIAFTEGADYQLMQALARRTGARYYRAFEATELTPVVDDILDRVDQIPSYDLAYLDEPSPLSPAATESVIQGPVESEGGGDPDAATRSRLLSWLPVALLVGLGLVLAYKRRPFFSSPDGSNRGGLDSQQAPPAQLLDFGGMLGETGGSISLGSERTTVGRDPHNDLVIPDDTVSSEHAVIEAREGRYWLQDRRSTNGTRLANKKVVPEQRYALKGGDRIRFADVDLMFVVEGYVPGGDTVYLSSSTTPPHGWTAAAEKEPADSEQSEKQAAPHSASSQPRAEVQSGESTPRADDPDVPSKEIVFAEARERLDPASVFDLDEDLPGTADDSDVAPAQSDATPDQDPEAVARAERALAAISQEDSPEPEPPQLPEASDPPVQVDLSDAPTAEVMIRPPPPEPSGEAAELPSIDAKEMRECLDYHLDRVAEISPDFAAFVQRAFQEELRTALPVAAKELIEQARQSGKIGQRAYTHDRIRFVICGIPGAMESAQQLFGDTYGGFTRLLSEQLQAPSFRTDRCEILALLTFGHDQAPWVSLSIVPAEGYSPRIDLLSYEFLTEQERAEIEPKSDPQVSQSGLA